MKFVLSILLSLIAVCGNAATNWLVWNKSASTNVTHYWINIGTNAPIVVQAPATNYALVTLGATNVSVYVRSVISFFTGGITNTTTSDPSPTLNFEIAPPPTNFRLQGSIESADSPSGPWQTEANTTLYVDMRSERFYRMIGYASRQP